MSRSVKEWRGKTDDAQPTKACKRRIVERQDRKCALTGREFRPGDVIEYDHITPLWLGGENRETNLQAVIGEAHKRKTKAEAAVRSKVNDQTNKHLGIARPKQKIKSRGFGLSHHRAKREARDQLPIPPRRKTTPMPEPVADLVERLESEALAFDARQRAMTDWASREVEGRTASLFREAADALTAKDAEIERLTAIEAEAQEGVEIASELRARIAELERERDANRRVEQALERDIMDARARSMGAESEAASLRKQVEDVRGEDWENAAHELLWANGNEELFDYLAAGASREAAERRARALTERKNDAE